MQDMQNAEGIVLTAAVVHHGHEATRIQQVPSSRTLGLSLEHVTLRTPGSGHLIAQVCPEHTSATVCCCKCDALGIPSLWPCVAHHSPGKEVVHGQSCRSGFAADMHSHILLSVMRKPAAHAVV